MTLKFLIIIFLLFSLVSPAQDVIKKNAEKLYSQANYIDAIEFYQKLVNRKNVQEDDLRKISNCYAQLFNYPKAEQYLKKLSLLYPANFSEKDLMNYLQILKYNENYTEASSIIDKLYKKNSKNLEAMDHMKRQAYYTELKKDSDNYTVKNIEGINTADAEFSPVFLFQEQQMLFSSNRRNVSAVNETYSRDNTYFMDLYKAEKEDSERFHNVSRFPRKIVTKYHDGPIVLSNDQKIMYLTRSSYLEPKAGKKERAVNLKLFTFTLDTVSHEWGNPVSFDYNSDDYSIGHPAITNDGKRIYFVSDMPGGYGQTDIWMCDLKNGKWGEPQNLGNSINTEGREMFPYVHDNGTLFFSTDGRAGLGGLDVYFSSISLDEFFEPQNLGYPLNTNADDFGFYMSKDLSTGYISSNRKGGKGKDDIYFFRSKKPLLNATITGFVYDENTQKTLPGAKVYLVNKNNKTTEDSMIVNSSGSYLLNIANKTGKYEIAVGKLPDYSDIEIDLPELNYGDNKVNVYLTRYYKLVNKITDANTGLPISDVSVILTDRLKGEKVLLKTDEQGYFETTFKEKQKNDSLVYTVQFQKEGYINIINDLNVKLDTIAIVHLSNQYDFKMSELKKGVDLGKTIKMEPIYFDVNKATIRPDAAIELDKIVKLMNENKGIFIELGAHTDCRNSNQYNMKLSESRAKASQAYIVGKGIDKKRVVSKGYGESKPVANCTCEATTLPLCTEEQHQKNRRTEFVVVKF